MGSGDAATLELARSLALDTQATIRTSESISAMKVLKSVDLQVSSQPREEADK